MNEEEQFAFQLGSNAGEVFVDNVYDLLKEFISRYESSDPGFKNEFYVESFLKTVRNNLDIDIIVWDKFYG